MKAPYRILEFTASSGNTARVKIFRPVGDRMHIDIAWVDSPSDADIKEHDAWLPGAYHAINPTERMAGMVSIVVEDDEERAAAVAAFMHPSSHPENN